MTVTCSAREESAKRFATFSLMNSIVINEMLLVVSSLVVFNDLVRVLLSLR